MFVWMPGFWELKFIISYSIKSVNKFCLKDFSSFFKCRITLFPWKSCLKYGFRYNGFLAQQESKIILHVLITSCPKRKDSICQSVFCFMVKVFKIHSWLM